ncbi:MAG: rRNA maturation RNase YbeY [Gemmatimonadaceae bacterium]|nr:rRNA maturation RNase YbeY [Gemmatimonadaceae bacterium]
MPRAYDIRVGVAGIASPLATARVQRVVTRVLAAERVPRAALSVTFVSRPRIAAMNWSHLRHRGPTDVITFAHEAPAALGVIGDVYVAPAVARANARAAGCLVTEELERLIIHGTLHVLGWVHPEGAERERSAMWRRQEALLAARRAGR